ncbi:DNA-processing protein DprA [Aureibacillus halotolerans]|uniref:DNA processing protein n=1 Tax=Aureibacillus halotolerans TaxID=1508390 RepID=A0A4R6U587_9BACI|nr:DNA-processing protein DprA [Aureibacillus halotolerans]TDQ39635.1 DNA processing protein [Aureibacillus halotolerans]
MKLATKRERLLLLHHGLQGQWKPLKRAFDVDEDLNIIFKMSPSELAASLQLSPAFASSLHSFILRTSPTELEEAYAKEAIEAITLFDDLYPFLLKHIYDPPWVLYVKGTPSLLNAQRPTLAVVGSRKPSSDCLPSLETVLPPLVKAGYCIVSGLAFGADRMAHDITLAHHGVTFAVLGGGFSHLYPKEHKPLAEAITAQGLLISEYPPHTTVQRWHFPARNRIVSGLSNGVLIAEAKEKSGTLITARVAMEQNRDVFVLPGSVHHAKARGSNRLIQDGAIPVIEAEDIELHCHLSG